MKNNLVKRLTSFVLALVLLVGIVPTVSFATGEETGDVVNVTHGKTFTMKEEYYEVLTSHELYGEKDFLAYVWATEFVIWFFDDISDVKFYMWDRGPSNFGLNPSKTTTFTAYLYDRYNLNLKTVDANKTVGPGSRYNYGYEFIASFSIYTNPTYSKYFYEVEGSEPLVPVQPRGDVVNVTNEKTFTTKREHYELITNHELYGKKDFLAYVWATEFVIWFFDDISDVKFYMWDRGPRNFGLRPSEKTTFSAYVYDRYSLNLKSSSENKYVDEGSGYNYGYEFLASFDIYTDNTYRDIFYEADNNRELLQTFEALQPQEAKDFLRFIAGAKDSVKIEEKLPEYYNLLTGEILDPLEETKTKTSFLTYCYYCLDAQLAQSNERIDFGKNYLIKWVEENTAAANIIFL